MTLKGTMAACARHVEDVVSSPTAYKGLSDLSDCRRAVGVLQRALELIRDPRAADGGTAFRPTAGQRYYALMKLTA